MAGFLKITNCDRSIKNQPVRSVAVPSSAVYDWLQKYAKLCLSAASGRLSDRGRLATPSTCVLIVQKVRHPCGHTTNLSVAYAAMKPRGATSGAGERIKALR